MNIQLIPMSSMQFCDLAPTDGDWQASAVITKRIPRAKTLCVAEPDKQRPHKHAGDDARVRLSVQRGLASIVTQQRVCVLYDLEDNEEEEETSDSDGDGEDGEHSDDSAGVDDRSD